MLSTPLFLTIKQGQVGIDCPPLALTHVPLRGNTVKSLPCLEVCVCVSDTLKKKIIKAS